jgi:NAD(P)-dependent dehydrogenase (short-subunit alcohol dehydrogenase family)
MGIDQTWGGGMFDLTGKTALITGAGQSIGAAMAATLADAGATVVVNDLRPETAERTVETIRSSGGPAVATPFDVTELDAVIEGVHRAERSAGPIDVLVNNAGIVSQAGVKFFREADPDYWHRWVDLNLYGVMNCCKAVIDGMCERRFGRVVTISSGAGVSGLAIGMSAYAAGKGGAISFMRHLALETASFGITANTLALGMMDNMAGTGVGQSLGSRVPVGRLGTGRDVGTAIVWLAAEGSWVTGQTININGGSLTT